MTNHSKQQAANQLTVERVFNATPERLWQHWTDPKLYAKWLNPGKHDLKIHKFDVRVGGECQFDMVLDDGTARPDGGVFFVLDKPNRIVSGSPDKSFLLEVTFTPVDAKRTRMVVVSTGIPPEWHGMARDGWGRSMNKLADLVEVPGPGEGFRIVRFFNAPPAKVYAMWATKEGLQTWWALSAKDMGYTFKVNKLDVRTGGEYDIVMSNKEHGELHNHGKYIAVVPDKLIEQQWHFDIFLGPGEKPYPIAVKIEFEDWVGMPGTKGTKMTFTQGPMVKPEYTEGSRQGVMANFRHLATALEA